MIESQLTEWVRQNCKFAQMQKTLSPQELQATINNLILQLQPQLVPGANYVATRQQVSTALQSALAQRGAGLQANQKAVDEVMKGLGFKMPAQQPMQMGPQGWEDPNMAKFRQQRQPVAPQAQPRQMPRKQFE